MGGPVIREPVGAWVAIGLGDDGGDVVERSCPGKEIRNLLQDGLIVVGHLLGQRQTLFIRRRHRVRRGLAFRAESVRDQAAITARCALERILCGIAVSPARLMFVPDHHPGVVFGEGCEVGAEKVEPRLCARSGIFWQDVRKQIGALGALEDCLPCLVHVGCVKIADRRPRLVPDAAQGIACALFLCLARLSVEPCLAVLGLDPGAGGIIAVHVLAALRQRRLALAGKRVIESCGELRDFCFAGNASIGDGRLDRVCLHLWIACRVLLALLPDLSCSLVGVLEKRLRKDRLAIGDEFQNGGALVPGVFLCDRPDALDQHRPDCGGELGNGALPGRADCCVR